jgi:hypothetical protein
MQLDPDEITEARARMQALGPPPLTDQELAEAQARQRGMDEALAAMLAGHPEIKTKPTPKEERDDEE